MPPKKLPVRFVDIEEYPQVVQRFAWQDAVYHILTLVSDWRQPRICLICGRAFLVDDIRRRICSDRCRVLYATTLHKLHRRKVCRISRKFRQTPLYYILWSLVAKGKLSPKLLGAETFEDLPLPTYFVNLRQILDIDTFLEGNLSDQNEASEDTKHAEGGGER